MFAARRQSTWCAAGGAGGHRKNATLIGTHWYHGTVKLMVPTQITPWSQWFMQSWLTRRRTAEVLLRSAHSRVFGSGTDDKVERVASTMDCERPQLSGRRRVQVRVDWWLWVDSRPSYYGRLASRFSVGFRSRFDLDGISQQPDAGRDLRNEDRYPAKLDRVGISRKYQIAQAGE